MPSLMSTWLSNCAKYNPNGVPFVYGDKKTTWKELNARVNSLANALYDLGVRKGDKITIMFHNCTEFAEANFAIQKIGAIPVPLNYRFVAREIEYQTNNSDSTVFIFEDLWLDAVEEARLKLEKVKNYICFRRTGKDIPKDMLDYDETIKEYPASEPPSAAPPDDICVIIYTGGTTGLPKGVVLTYSNHIELVKTIASNMVGLLPDIKLPMELGLRVGTLLPIPGIGTIVSGIKSLFGNPTIQRFISSLLSRVIEEITDRQIIHRLSGTISSLAEVKILWTSFQLFHDAFYPVMMLSPMFGGLITCLFPEMVRFDPRKVMGMLERERPILFSNTPTGWKKIFDLGSDLDNYDKSSVAIMVTGGGVNPAKIKKKMLENFRGAFILDIFGQTEMTPAATFKFDSEIEKLKDRSVGKPVVETRIVDERGEEIKKPGEIGEILYRGGSVMKEYYKDAEKTAEAMKGGWFHSGDFGYVDEDGEIYLVGRGSECINTGGEKVYADGVEHILEENPKIERVCVFGVPDETWGEAVRAVLQLKEGESAREEEIRAWCRGKMVGYKIPKSVLFAEDLPVTAVGKVLKRKVKEKYGGK